MSPVLAGVAAVLLLWPQARPSRRVQMLADVGTRRGRRRGGPVVGAVAGCVAVLVVVGPAAMIAAAIGAVMIAHRVVLRRRVTGHAAGLGMLLDAVAVMIAELSVGAHPAHACRQAAEDVGRGGAHRDTRAVADVLTQMAGRAELGGDVAGGIEGAGLVHQSSWDRVAVAWRTAEQHGLPMADLLAAVRDDLVARRRFAERTRAALAGARATATVLALLPLLGIGLGQAMGARPLAILLGDGLGGILLVIGTALVATGLWWTERITAKVMTP